MRVLLVDDHPLFLDGLRNLLTSRGVEVVGVAHDGLEALDQARALRPDLILMDIQMPRCDGLAATRLIKAESPGVNIVMLTMSAEDEDLFEAIKSGACGYLLKTQETEEFFSLLVGTARGEPPLSPGLAAKILHALAQQGNEGRRGPPDSTPGEVLSPRALQVVTLVAHGLTYKEIGAQLGLTERTIKYHMGEIVQRLHVENRAQVIEYAKRTGLVR